MIGKLFKKTSYVPLGANNRHKGVSNPSRGSKPNVPAGMYVKCKSCDNIIYVKDLKHQSSICDKCNHYFRVTARERVEDLVDENTFEELFKEIKTANPLAFSGYDSKVAQQVDKTSENEAIITGTGQMHDNPVALAVMDAQFFMGSMGSVVGEKLTRLIEHATANSLPLIVFTASGGARMQEGVFSLMQMAKTSMALNQHAENGHLYISVLTEPTTGGVTASFAMLGDIIIAEPNALIGFAGPRVIEQTIRQKLPEGFQRSEFLLEHGFIDKIVKRQDMKPVLGRLLSMHKEVADDEFEADVD